ncbi:MAG TPA: methyltransferase domain-containing protein [Solirubrobacteraceae bacterium]|nr:methyltransferase domain-containing protein [Solirubrobacteraceae bacterium]
MVDALAPQPGQHVLELAAGPGETGFLVAELLEPGGRLISSDQSEAMVEIARARAAELGLTNVEFRVINAESIDLPVASLDAVLCRWGFMLMVDPAAALLETRRVLRAGGRLALAVWASPSMNPWLVVPNQAMIEAGLIEQPDPSAPGAFALSDADRLTALLEDAGFVEVQIEEVSIVRAAPSFEDWWEMHLDMSPSGRVVREAPPETARAVAAAVAERLERYRLEIPGMCLVAAASA